MPKMKFDFDFDFKPDARTTIAYRAGWEGAVTGVCAKQAVAVKKGKL